MKTLTIIYRDRTSESFKSKSLEKAKGILSRRGGIMYATYGGKIIEGHEFMKAKKKHDAINKAIQDGDLDAFHKLTGIQ